jgi:hypothetical protein
MTVSKEVTIFIEGHPIMFERGDTITIVESTEKTMEEAVSGILMESVNENIDGEPVAIDDDGLIQTDVIDQTIAAMADTMKEEMDPEQAAMIKAIKQKREEEDKVEEPEEVDDRRDLDASKEENKFDQWAASRGLEKVDGNYYLQDTFDRDQPEHGKLSPDELQAYMDEFEEFGQESEEEETPEIETSDDDVEVDEIDTLPSVHDPEEGVPEGFEELNLGVFSEIDKELMNYVNKSTESETGQQFLDSSIFIA